MTVTLELVPEVESLLQKRAKADGCELPDYVMKLIEKDVDRKRTFDDILEPFSPSGGKARHLGRRTRLPFH